MTSHVITPVIEKHRVLLCPYCIKRPEYHTDIYETSKYTWLKCPKCGLESFGTPAGRKRARQKWNNGEWKNNIVIERFKASPFNPWAAFGKNFGNPSQTATDVAHLLLTRDLNGHTNYQKSLDRDDLGLEEWVQHALEEALDLACYLQRLVPLIEMRLNKDKEYEEIITDSTLVTPEQIVAAMKDIGDVKDVSANQNNSGGFLDTPLSSTINKSGTPWEGRF